jgi:hypothetical protein
MDATTMATPTTWSLVAPRRTSRRLARVTILLVQRQARVHLWQAQVEGWLQQGGAQEEVLQKAKIKERAFLASHSDFDHDFDESSFSLSDEDFERHIEDKLNGMCFIVDTVGGLCTMALSEDVVSASDRKDIGNDSTSNVLPSADDLTSKVEELIATLSSLDKLLRQAACERREFKSKYKITLRELESARASVVVYGETECDECTLHMSNNTTL